MTAQLKKTRFAATPRTKPCRVDVQDGEALREPDPRTPARLCWPCLPSLPRLPCCAPIIRQFARLALAVLKRFRRVRHLPLLIGVESVCLVGVGAIVSRETIGCAREKAFGWRVRAGGSVRMAGRCNAGACGWRMQTSGSAQSARTKMWECADGRERSDVRMQGPRGRVWKQPAFAGRFRGCRDDGGFGTPGRWGGFGVLVRTCEAVCDPMEPPRAFLRR